MSVEERKAAIRAELAAMAKADLFDPEDGHGTADDLLCDGEDEAVDAFEALEKWYA